MARSVTASATAGMSGVPSRGMLGSSRIETQRRSQDYAWECFQYVLKTFPDDVEAINWLLQAGTALQRWPDLAEVLERFIQRNPADLAVRYALAGVLLRLGRYDLARLQYNAVHLLDSTYEGLPELAKALDNHQAWVAPHAC